MPCLHCLQALNLIGSAPKLAQLKIKEFCASGVHIASKWVLTLLGISPSGLQSVSLHLQINSGESNTDFEYSVVRETGESVAAMLGRLGAQVNTNIGW